MVTDKYFNGNWNELKLDENLNSDDGLMILRSSDDRRFSEYLKDGNCLVYVPADSELRLHFGDSGESGKVIFLLDTGSSVELFEERNNNSSGDIEYVLFDDAKLRLYELYNVVGDNNVNIKKKIICGNGSVLRREVFFAKGILSGVQTRIYLDDGAEASDTEVFIGDDKQEIRADTEIYHKGAGSKGNILVKGVLMDSAVFNSNAMLYIDERAQQTDTFLAEHVLLLSKNAKANIIPSLEIKANDVKASHAVSVSQIDNEQAFYLATRGLSDVEARKMIVLGFMKGAVDTLESEHIKSGFGKTFEEKLK